MLLSLLFGSRESLAIRNGSWPLSQTPGVLFGAQESAAGVRVSELESLSLSGVFAAANLLSAVLGALPLSVYRVSGRRREVAEDLSTQAVLHTAFNPEMTSVIARRTMEFHRLIWGAGCGEIEWDGLGNVRAVWPIEPWRVKPKRDPVDKSLYFLVDGVRKVAAADMIYVPLISLDGVAGRSFVDFALESLGLGLATQEFAARYFGNGARPGGVLHFNGTPEKPARQEFREEWEKAHGGPRRSNRVAVTWGNWSYTPDDGSFNARESQLLDQRRFTIEEVARWFNVPPHMLRELSRSTNNNIEQQSIDLLLYTFGPVLVMYEQEYDRKLLKPPSLYSKHNVAALMRGDSQARSAYYRELWNIGVFSINDILEMEERNPVDGGDEHFVPGNMAPLSRVVDRPAREPEENPVPPEGKDKPPPGAPAPDSYGPGLAAMRGLLASRLKDLSRIEGTELLRAAEKPGKFLDALDAIYQRHEDRLAEAVGPVLTAALHLHLKPRNPALFAHEFCAAAKNQVLELAGSVQAPQLRDAVKRLVEQWEMNRCAEWAAEFIQ